MVVEIRLTHPALKVLRFLLDTPALPRSGAEIGRATQVSSGTLYPMLVRLETAGWLSSEWEEVDPREQGRPRRRFYSLTPFGKNTANRELADLQINLAIPAWTT
jgi:DNA-binding PadR family transcriptional regulator